jgi:hypothetical protein
MLVIAANDVLLHKSDSQSPRSRSLILNVVNHTMISKGLPVNTPRSPKVSSLQTAMLTFYIEIDGGHQEEFERIPVRQSS